MKRSQSQRTSMMTCQSHYFQYPTKVAQNLHGRQLEASKDHPWSRGGSLSMTSSPTTMNMTHDTIPGMTAGMTAGMVRAVAYISITVPIRIRKRIAPTPAQTCMMTF